MALQSSGTIKLSDIATEFGGTTPHNLSEYYRGGARVPNTPANSAVPTSGTIKLTDFYGTSASSFTPVTRTYTSGTSVTETAPADCTNVIIAMWGGGGGGGASEEDFGNTYGGGGGGSSGYLQLSVAISGGQTLVYTVGAAGQGGTFGYEGSVGGNTVIASGTKTLGASYRATGGTFGEGTVYLFGGQPPGGSGGSTEIDVDGGVWEPYEPGTAGVSGSAGGQPTGGAGGSAVVGWNSNSYGAGGAGGNLNANGSNGSGGAIIFYYT